MRTTSRLNFKYGNCYFFIVLFFTDSMAFFLNLMICFFKRDTAGQERFRSVTRSYYRGAAGALLVYDIASRDSFNALQNWLTDARNLASPNIIIVLVGNKKDLEAQREVSFQEASQFARENELIFLECSAFSGENVEETFLRCARTIITNIENGEINPDRIGSGIQFGDMSLRDLQRNSSDKQSSDASSSSCAGARCSIWFNTKRSSNKNPLT